MVVRVVAFREPSRADDERLLRALALYEKGVSLTHVAHTCGYPHPSGARNDFDRVKRDYAASLRGLKAKPIREKRPPRYCAVPGCGAEIDPRNRSGVCRGHNHLGGYCTCSQCAARV